jgi:glycyl-tRNA synthetase beta chain
VGYFALGLEPSGTRDPYALRRAALGVVRILMEQPWFLPLAEAVGSALEGYPAEVRESEDAGGRVQEFLVQRFRHVAQSVGHRYDSVNAVVAVQRDDLHDGGVRLRALTSLRKEPRYEEDFVSLAAAYKRIRNLVKEQEEGELDPATLAEPPEIELFRALERVEAGLERSLERRDYLSALREIAGLRPAVDGFLGSSRSEGVLVLAPEPERRRNRLALLRRAGRLFRRVADFSEIVVEGESGPERG